MKFFLFILNIFLYMSINIILSCVFYNFKTFNRLANLFKTRLKKSYKNYHFITYLLYSFLVIIIFYLASLLLVGLLK